jgi:minichromosome maintenance protein 10
MYNIWKLSDLAFHLQNSTVSLFLFGESHKQLWKTAEGSVVAVLNPSILPSREVRIHLQITLVDSFFFVNINSTSQNLVLGFFIECCLSFPQKQSSDVALSLDNPKKLMMIGMSQDFGVCQSARKSDGKRCSNFVNKYAHCLSGL